MVAKLTFTANEIKEMQAASAAGHNGWKDKKLDTVKRKIKDHKRIYTYDLCCYCQRDTTEEFNMVLDIEHIIPKSARVKHMFTMKNLSVSCKKCNMKIKNEDLSFLVDDVVNLPSNIFKSRYYKFIHPNLDKVFRHLERNCVQQGRVRLVKYHFPNNSDKGKYTYEYFKLKEFEIEKANQAQGLRKNRINNQKAEEAFRVLTQ
ncbi:HNH endonuclease [Vibrio lentus]|uniref:HNH endonuclease n=1 Tax=Vibrio TaxID=662 RepID=UPI00037B74E5|nr:MULTISPECIES: HNH endonuclease [Vibrio]OCH56832.1 hypothetical protein A6E08_19690 [Vibrio lentus]PMI60190.1 hypothetical protein BCU41_20035 [Vibrio lentus]